MTEIEIVTWIKLDGTFEVTAKRSRGKGDGYLHDVDELFRYGLSKGEAEDYARKLFKRYAKGKNIATLKMPDSFGQEVKSGLGGTTWGMPKVKQEYEHYDGSDDE